MQKFFHKFFHLYVDGFKNTVAGKKLLFIILIKLIIIFAILKIFFFPDFLRSKFSTDRERSNYVIEQLTKTNKR